MNLDENRGKPKRLFIKETSEDKENPGKQIYWCDLCGSPMRDLHCKLICRRCGFKRDCSDP